MKIRPSLCPLVRSDTRPVGAPSFESRYLACTGRHTVPDCPQNIPARLGPTIRFVQHLNLPSSEMTFGQPSSLVTLRSPGKRQ